VSIYHFLFVVEGQIRHIFNKKKDNKFKYLQVVG